MYRSSQVLLTGTSNLTGASRDQAEKFLRTDHLDKDLKGRSIRGTLVTGTAQVGKFALSLVSVVVLARLLSPEEFGLVAMVATVTGFLRIFKDLGLSTATVQREGITHAQVSNLFWINVAVSALSGLLIAAAAPVIAWFYREPRLVGITFLLAVTFPLSGAAVQHLALLNRQMRFKAIALVELGSMAASLVVGVVMALLGYGYWSLVGSALALEAVVLLLTWSASRWRPQFPTPRAGTRPLLTFGANLSAGNFIATLARGVDIVLIGRFYGSDAVGLYSRATALLVRPLDQITSPISAVFLPALSRLQAQPERYRRAFMQVYEAIALSSFPFTALLLPLAHPITLVLLGPKWEKAAIIFAGFTVAALYLPLGMAANWLITSQGRGRDLLRANSILSALTVAAFTAGLPFGPAGVAIAFSASGLLVRLPIYYSIAGRQGPVRTKDLWVGLCRHLPLWGVVFAATWATRTLVVDLAPVIQLLVCVPVGLLAGTAWTCAFATHRRVALSLLHVLLELGNWRKAPAA